MPTDKELKQRAHLQIIVPALVVDGHLYDYSVGAKGGRLKSSKLAILHNNLVGYDDRIDICPTYLVRSDYLATFLKQLETWSLGIKKNQFDWIVPYLSNSVAQNAKESGILPDSAR